MPTADWGIRASDVDSFDRQNQFTPYQGPLPPNAVYKWKVLSAYFAAATGDKLPSLRVLLSLVARSKAEKKYEGFSCMMIAPVADNTQFRYVPFLDAIGVSGADFKARTKTDNEGKILTIGRWKNNGSSFVAAQLDDNDFEGSKYPKTIGWCGPLVDTSDADDEEEYDEDEDEYDNDDNAEDEEEDDEEEEYEEEEPAPAPKRRTTTRKARR